MLLAFMDRWCLEIVTVALYNCGISEVKVKCQKTCFDITVTLLKGQGQRSRSSSRVKFKGQGQFSGAQRSILGARLCQVQQPAKKSHYQSKVFVCVSVISGRVRIIAQNRLLIWEKGTSFRLSYFYPHRI